MKRIALFLFLFASSQALAATKGLFLGFQAMIQVLGSEYGGSNPDAETLYRAMNVAEQGSAMGPGKGITTADRILNFTCMKQKNYQCSILLRPSPKVVMDQRRKIIEFKTQGTEADELAAQFELDQNREFHFITSDGLFKMDIVPGRFHLIFDGNGLSLE